MSKKVARVIFSIYQAASSSLPTCRFRPTCSQYTLEAIEKYGLFKGAVVGLKRVASCHPFSRRPLYDPLT